MMTVDGWDQTPTHLALLRAAALAAVGAFLVFAPMIFAAACWLFIGHEVSPAEDKVFTGLLFVAWAIVLALAGWVGFARPRGRVAVTVALGLVGPVVLIMPFLGMP